MQPPPGYPFLGPLPSRPPPPPNANANDEDAATSIGLAGFAVAFAGVMTGMGFLLVALMVGQLGRSATAMTAGTAPTSARPSAADSEGAEGSPHPRVVDSPVASPTLRNIPTHPLRLLEGCSAEDIDGLEAALNASITRGAPLFNDGDVLGCATEYEQTAAGLETTLAASCHGPAGALADGRATAARADGPNARAWAMRDAFDGLLEVIERSRAGGVSNL
jgi:hypothetical protein